MRSVAYMCPLIPLPTFITGLGKYLTREGELIVIDAVSDLNCSKFTCHGTYPDGCPDTWHRSGRLFANKKSMNDIVVKL